MSSRYTRIEVKLKKVKIRENKSKQPLTFPATQTAKKLFKCISDMRKKIQENCNRSSNENTYVFNHLHVFLNRMMSSSVTGL